MDHDALTEGPINGSPAVRSGVPFSVAMKTNIADFGWQTLLLLYKHVLITIRRWPSLIIRLLYPVVLIVIMWAAIGGYQNDNITSSSKLIGGIPKCTVCFSIFCFAFLFNKNNFSLVL